MGLQTTTKGELDTLRGKLGDYAEHTKSEATKSAYAADWERFKNWCEHWQTCSLPATPETCALYVAWLDKQGRSVSTIQRALTSINQAHLLSGHERPVDARLRELLKGLRRMRGVRPSKKSAITLDTLRRLVELTPGGVLGVRDRALLLVGWMGAFRRSELIGLDVSDLEERDRGIVVYIRKSKTDQEGIGRQIGLPYVDNEKRLCAPRAVRRWLEVAQIKEGPVFRAVGSHGRDRIVCEVGASRLGDRSVANVVKAAVKRAGLNPSDYGGHSLRSGLATSLAAAGVDERKIMGITGHKSLAVLRGYIQSGSIFVDHPIKYLFEGPGSQRSGEGS